MSSTKVSTCYICKFTTDHDEDILWNGEWMRKQSTTVHYFCLLLSTNLPQRGGDSSGILGFLLRDIRKEANIATKRKCVYCNKPNASISCAICKCYFHLICGREQSCSSHFFGEFPSYCVNCAPIDEYKRDLIENPPKGRLCDICLTPIPIFTLTNVVYGDCCRKGFAHRACMQRYALASGYYLRCIWCRKAEFREQIRYQSIFVPDRDALWEREKRAFQELYNKYKRCDWETCICPNGRDYFTKTWIIILCSLCASFGTHRQCKDGSARNYNKMYRPSFKCPTCVAVEEKHESNENSKSMVDVRSSDKIDTTFYVLKTNATNASDVPSQMTDEAPVFSEEETISNSSTITVINSEQAMARELVPNRQIKDFTTQPGGKRCIDNFPNPLQLKRAYSVQGKPYFYLEIYDFDTSLNCLGTCKLRFDENDERIRDKCQQALEQLAIKPCDVYEHTSDRGIYQKIDNKIDEMRENSVNNN